MKLSKKSTVSAELAVERLSTIPPGIGSPVVDMGEEGEDDLALRLVADGGAAVEPEVLWVKVPASHDGERLDKVLAFSLPDYSRGRLQSWIEQGLVTLDGAPTKIRMPVFAGDEIRVQVAPLAEENAFVAEPVPLDVVYEDADILVIHKPAGLVVHPGAGHWTGTLLNGLLHRYPSLMGLPRAGIVHRLDKETSGLMVVAKTLPAQTDLVKQLQARSVKRTYLALVWGQTLPNGTIDAQIGRDSRDRTRMAIVPGQYGKPARTHYTQIDYAPLAHAFVSLVKCQLETGRTHQIRVHMESIGHPLLGDPTYTRVGRGIGKAPLPELTQAFQRQALHAYRLGLIHPRTGELMSWQADLPDDMVELCEALNLPTEALA